MSTHNVCFHGEIRKILCGYPRLSVAIHLCRLISLSCLPDDTLDPWLPTDAYVQVDLSVYLVHMHSYKKCYAPAKL